MGKRVGEIALRMVILLVGLSIAHLGVTLFLLVELGSDPFNVFVQGVYRTLSGIAGLRFLSHGYTHIAINLVIIAILLLVDRRYIRPGTVVCMAFGGPIIDFFTALLAELVHPGLPFAVRLVILALGCVILAYGMTLVVKSEAGTGPNDLVALAISEKAHFPFGITRTVTDISFVVIGVLLGGRVGIGTIVCAVLVGMVAERFFPVNERLVRWLLRRTGFVHS